MKAKHQVVPPDQPPLIDNENGDVVRFQVPTPPNFPAFESLLSILSLVLLAGLAAICTPNFRSNPGG
jgi:hypothetical protein